MECTWSYRCGNCNELVEVPDITAHVAAHRAEPDWPGHVNLTRVDKDAAPETAA